MLMLTTRFFFLRRINKSSFRQIICGDLLHCDFSTLWLFLNRNKGCANNTAICFVVSVLSISLLLLKAHKYNSMSFTWNQKCYLKKWIRLKIQINSKKTLTWDWSLRHSVQKKISTVNWSWQFKKRFRNRKRYHSIQNDTNP